jgi:hypothetical protein
MAIKSNACEGCNADVKLERGSTHIMPDGTYVRCVHVKTAVEDQQERWPGTMFCGAYETCSGALRRASKINGGVLPITSGPHQFWVVLRD